MAERTYTLPQLHAMKTDFLAQTATVAAVLDAASVQVSVTEVLTAFLQFVAGYSDAGEATPTKGHRRSV